MGENLRRDAISKRITKETFNEFQNRVTETMCAVPTNTIDNIIESMPKRIQGILANNGQRLKY